MAINITSDFDGGSINCVKVESPEEILLELEADPVGGELYWFYFRLTGVRSEICRIQFLNAGDAFRLDERKNSDIPGPWVNYSACASYDRVKWFRVPTTFKNGVIEISYKPTRDAIYFASFAPYTRDQHSNLIATALTSSQTSLEVLGKTKNGHEIELITVGSHEKQKKSCWICARQHPSETMAEWFAEGLLLRLTDDEDPLVRKIIDEATFFIVPCMNPDGAWDGRTRRNGSNVDLNRQWVNPSYEESPEVLMVQEKMSETGVDFFMDVHGEEELPYVFLGGPLEVPSVTNRMIRNFRKFQEGLQIANPDYKRGYEYPGGPPQNPDLRMAWNYIGEKYQCLSILVEQPFKDAEHSKNEFTGWSSDRSKKLGAASLTALNSVLGDLR
tara:strand:- start:1199 stop:2359 length:1161 start_codon:yes stop_codon:yes gene_type:complete